MLRKYGCDNFVKSKEYKRIINKKTILNYANKLNISSDNIDMVDDDLIIKNYCKHHPEFIINRYVLKSRLLYGINNICTICNPINEKSSIKEKEICDFIENELNIRTIKHKIENKEIDIFLPDYNIGIEFNGLY